MITSVHEDRERLARLLLQRLERIGGLRPKPERDDGAESEVAAWRSQLEAAEIQPLEAHFTSKEADVHPAPVIDAHGEVWPPGMKIVNGHLARSLRAQGMLKPPNSFGYIHLAAELERPSLLRRNSDRKVALLHALKEAAAALRKSEPRDVRRADVFDAIIIPPGSKEGRRVLQNGNYDVHIAEFDVVMLVECQDVEAARRVRRSAAFLVLKRLVDDAAAFVHCVTAQNAKRIDEVDKNRDGIFLFNFFFAADIEAKGSAGVDVLLSVWEYTAGWWTAYANLDNSTPLRPLPGERSQYSLINHARWDHRRDILPHLIFRPSLESFVLKNFTANDIMAMPILYRLA